MAADPVLTVLAAGDDRARPVPGRVAGAQAVVAEGDLPAAIGWELKPQGLCRDDVCVPVRDRAALHPDGGGVDLVAAARLLGHRVVVDADAGVVAVSHDAASRRRTVAGGEAVEFSLPDLEGRIRSLGEWSGKKKLLVCWASW